MDTSATKWKLVEMMMFENEWFFIGKWWSLESHTQKVKVMRFSSEGQTWKHGIRSILEDTYRICKIGLGMPTYHFSL